MNTVTVYYSRMNREPTSGRVGYALWVWSSEKTPYLDDTCSRLHTSAQTWILCYTYIFYPPFRRVRL